MSRIYGLLTETRKESDEMWEFIAGLFIGSSVGLVVAAVLLSLRLERVATKVLAQVNGYRISRGDDGRYTAAIDFRRDGEEWTQGLGAFADYDAAWAAVCRAGLNRHLLPQFRVPPDIGASRVWN